MAMVCVTGSRECDGCMACHEPRQNASLGDCAQCGEPVLSGDDRYKFPDGEIVHDDCVLDFIRANYYTRGEG